MRAPTTSGDYPLGRRLVRITAALVLLGAAAAMLFWQQQVRYGEMSLAGTWFDLVLAGSTHTNRDAIYFSWTGGELIGLRNTWECTVALLAGPLLGIGAVLLALTRIPWHRLVTGLALALVLIVAVNQLRLAMIAVSLQRWGMDGYALSHTVIGSIFAIAGFVVAAMVFLKIAGASPTGRHRPAPHLG
ncbi:exosortase/archaeosortase family protein [Ruania alba]|uniref:Exosortase/archaeosortase family protein n=1 Tax=Ruania alba TaxID=648782 RepID=A0A1H5CDX6_9MICO|nr:exosortase/archaeosortase family protein [Ruania alba]SED64826.1 exosortase/archaeosortase family protein [Ruania alba]